MEAQLLFSAAPLRGHHSICSISPCPFHHFLLLQPSAWPTVGFLLTDSSKFSIVCPVSPPSVFCTCPSHLTLSCPSYFFQSGQSLGLLPFCKCHCLKIIHHSRSPYHLVNIPFNISPLTLTPPSLHSLLHLFCVAFASKCSSHVFIFTHRQYLYSLELHFSVCIPRIHSRRMLRRVDGRKQLVHLLPMLATDHKVMCKRHSPQRLQSDLANKNELTTVSLPSYLSCTTPYILCQHVSSPFFRHRL